MGEPSAAKNPPTADSKAVTVTAAEAAKKVFRDIPAVDKQGAPTGKIEKVAVKEEEVFSWAVKGECLIVVTVDGQKLEGRV